MAKKIKVLDNVSGVEQIINVSSLASNGTITGSDLMLIEQSNTLKKVSITDLSAEFGGGGSGGNLYKLELAFDKANNSETTTEVPLGAVLQELQVNIGANMTGADSTIMIDGTSPITLAVENENDSYSSFLGNYIIPLFNRRIETDEDGVLKFSIGGSGVGVGNIFLIYNT